MNTENTTVKITIVQTTPHFSWLAFWSAGGSVCSVDDDSDDVDDTVQFRRRFVDSWNEIWGTQLRRELEFMRMMGAILGGGALG